MPKGPKPLVEYTPSTSGHSSPLTPEPSIRESVGCTSPHSVHTNIDYSETRETPNASWPAFEDGLLAETHSYGPIASTSTCNEDPEPPMKKSRHSCGPLPQPSNLSGLGYSIDAPIDLDKSVELDGKEEIWPQLESDVHSVINCIKKEVKELT